jgi:hypothetical protein
LSGARLLVGLLSAYLTHAQPKMPSGEADKILTGQLLTLGLVALPDRQITELGKPAKKNSRCITGRDAALHDANFVL